MGQARATQLRRAGARGQRHPRHVQSGGVYAFHGEAGDGVDGLRGCERVRVVRGGAVLLSGQTERAEDVSSWIGCGVGRTGSVAGKLTVNLGTCFTYLDNWVSWGGFFMIGFFFFADGNFEILGSE